MTTNDLSLKNPYILLTPGPLTTSAGVRSALVKDWCTWDDEYNQGVVQVIRKKLVQLATDKNGYTSVLMQGSGSFCVESVIGTCTPKTGAKLLILVNGAYGDRIVKIANTLNIPHVVLNFGEQIPYVYDMAQETLAMGTDITHIAMVHCETTTGVLNDIAPITKLAKSYGITTIVDAMSSFGGIPMDIDDWHIDILISSANKCIQGVPGFGFVVVKTELLSKCKNNARSLALDLYDQWLCMEQNNGKWRFTSPTHTVHAFYHALLELADEGGVSARYERYKTNQQILVDGMVKLGFSPLLSRQYHSPIITSFFNPTQSAYDFKTFYDKLKQQGFVIYPGRVSNADCFRVGNIGDIDNDDMHRFIGALEKCIYW